MYTNIKINELSTNLSIVNQDIIELEILKDQTFNLYQEKYSIENIEKILVSEGHLSKNDKYIITSSMPTHWKGHTNMMKINVVDL